VVDGQSHSTDSPGLSCWMTLNATEIGRGSMFHIIGVEHSVQVFRRKITEGNLVLATCLEQAIQALRPTLVAEEHSIEALGKRYSIACAIACKFGLEHAFCDPTTKQREVIRYRDIEYLKEKVRNSDSLKVLSDYDVEVRANAIEIAREFRKREEFWLNSIETKDLSTTLFVCGDAHVCSFRGLLSDRGIPSEIHSRGIGMNEKLRKLIADAGDYLRDNPNADVA
jgi:hypothetical protein